MPGKIATAPPMNAFVFLNHGEADDDDARKRVRSRAAQYSHRVGPRKPKQPRKKKDEASCQSDSSPETDTQNSGPASTRRSSTVSRFSSSRRGSLAKDNHDQLSATVTPAPSPIGLGSYADEPFDAYPVPTQPWFPKIMHYMSEFMLRGWSALPTTAADRQEALTWVQRLTLSEPTYFLMNMLSVAGDLAQRRQMEPGVVLWLNSQVMATLNQALRDPKKALQAATVLTVGRIALREIVVGDYEVGCTVHRPAFARMIKLAGGLDTLGLPPLVRLHLAWAERLMKKKTGTSITELEPSLCSEAEFREAGSAREDDKEVLNRYLPSRPRKSDGF